MSTRQIPPWLQEQLMKMQETQKSLQDVMTQKQHLEMGKMDAEKALEELKKTTDDNAVFKQAGMVLIKSTKKDMIEEIEETQEMSNTRITVLAKQEERIKKTLQEQEAKITELMKSAEPPKDPQG